MMMLKLNILQLFSQTGTKNTATSNVGKYKTPSIIEQNDWHAQCAYLLCLSVKLSFALISVM